MAQTLARLEERVASLEGFQLDGYRPFEVLRLLVHGKQRITVAGRAGRGGEYRIKCSCPAQSLRTTVS